MCSLSSPAIEKEAAGFFASGRRLEFEECIANLNVDFPGNPGRSAEIKCHTSGRQILCGVCRCGQGSRWSGSVGTSQARLQPQTHYHSLVWLKEIGGSFV